MGSSRVREWCIGWWILYHWASRPSLSSFYLLTFQIMLFMPHKFALKCATQQAARNIRYNKIQENSKLGHYAVVCWGKQRLDGWMEVSRGCSSPQPQCWLHRDLGKKLTTAQALASRNLSLVYKGWGLIIDDSSWRPVWWCQAGKPSWRINRDAH